MAYEFIIVEKRDHLTIVTINRPQVMNALHVPANRELDEAFNEFSEDPNAWVAIITGAGKRAFSAGNDLKWQAEHGGTAVREGVAALKGGIGGITKRFDCFKPIIAAVNGFALGGGFEIVLACDVTVAVESATFGLPEPRVGLVARGGGMHRLPRQIPYRQAMGMLLTGRRINAQEALQMGLINQIVAPGDLMAEAERWASEILECSPFALRATKEAVLKGLGLTLEEAMEKEFPGMKALWESEDYKDGPRAFAEKRTPPWKVR